MRPVVEEIAAEVTINLPSADVWFHFPSMEAVAKGTDKLVLPVTMDSMPAFLRGGRVLPVRERLRRSSTATVADPITLYVAADEAGNAVGELYLDDTHSFDFQKGGYALQTVTLSGNTLSMKRVSAVSFDAPTAAAFSSAVVIERIVIVGRKVSKATAAGQSIDLVPGAAGSVVLRRPMLAASGEWTVDLEF